ncbi:MAG: SLBB domain-containing protein [Candidatus Neomarinimicrobiota bacterium]|nr:SLBB domain-containing protein [Candidatus Neomarinimicrobiota bacterium]MDX9780537.1 SLBB domain-containing protein [bacterium]
MKKISIFVLVCWMVLPLFAQSDLQQLMQGMPQQPTITMIPPPAELETEIDPDEYIVGAGDQFLVEKLQEMSTITVPVSPTGTITIPGSASLRVSGMTLNAASRLISEKVGPYVSVSLYEIKKIRIPVSGAVKNPGIYTVSAANRLSDLIQKVPLRYLGKDFEIHIRSEKDTSIINIYNFYLKGDKDSNPYLHAGESVFVPFADPEKECVEVYGPVMVRSFVPFIRGESLGDFYRRKVMMSDVMNYEKMVVIRDEKQYSVTVSDMDDFVLEPKDKIEFIALSKIMVSGHVNRPGTYDFIPGHTVVDYIAMAGGVAYKGSNKSAIVIRGNEKLRNPMNSEIRRGDIILVRRSAEDILIGEISILSFVSMLATIASTVITAFIAAGNL